VAKRHDGLDKGNTLVHKEFKKLEIVNDVRLYKIIVTFLFFILAYIWEC